MEIDPGTGTLPGSFWNNNAWDSQRQDAGKGEKYMKQTNKKQWRTIVLLLIYVAAVTVSIRPPEQIYRADDPVKK